MALCLLLLLAIVGLLVPSCMAKSVLYTDEILYTSQALHKGSYKFIVQYDCNVVLYDDDQDVWSTGTNGAGSFCYLKMQSDGNLVLYSDIGNAIWASNTSGNQANFVLVLQSDGNVVIYGPAIWSTNTHIGTLGMVITNQKNDNLTGQPKAVDVATGAIVNRKITMVTAKN